MFCSKCGKANDDLAKFCQQCGANLQPEPSPSNPPGPSAVVSQTPLKYAGFWNRFAAVFIDGLILGFGGSILNLPFLIAKGMSNLTSYPFWIIFDFFLSLVMGWLYCTLLESSSKQATIGKMAVGIIVTDLNGDRISFGRANGRWWGKAISFLILGIGYIMAGFTKKKQALHDIMADTLVVGKSEKVNKWVTTLAIIIWIISILGIIATIAIPQYEKYREARIKQEEEKELQTQTTKTKMAKVINAMINLASAVAAYREDLQSWPFCDSAVAIQTSLGVSIPGDIISSITVISPKADQAIITATMTGINPEINGKTYTLTAKAKSTERGVFWEWGGTAPTVNPNHPVIYYNRGYAYLELGNNQLATTDFQKSIELNKNIRDFITRDCYIGLSIACFVQNKIEDAKANYQKAIEIEPLCKNGLDAVEKRDNFSYTPGNKQTVNEILKLFQVGRK